MVSINPDFQLNFNKNSKLPGWYKLAYSLIIVTVLLSDLLVFFSIPECLHYILIPLAFVLLAYDVFSAEYLFKKQAIFKHVSFNYPFVYIHEKKSKRLETTLDVRNTVDLNLLINFEMNRTLNAGEVFDKFGSYNAMAKLDYDKGFDLQNIYIKLDTYNVMEKFLDFIKRGNDNKL